MDTAMWTACQLIDQPAVNGAKHSCAIICSLCYSWHVLIQPLELECAEVCADGESGHTSEVVCTTWQCLLPLLTDGTAQYMQKLQNPLAHAAQECMSATVAYHQEVVF